MDNKKLYPYLIQFFNEKKEVHEKQVRNTHRMYILDVKTYIKNIHTVRVIGIPGKHGVLH